MKSNKRYSLKSFTLVELMITLIISSLVIAFTMSAFLITSKLHINFKKRTTEVIDFQKLNYLLQKDNLEAFQIQKLNNGFVFHKDSMDISYQYNEVFLIRNQNNRLDSFNFESLKVSLDFKTEKVNDNDLVDKIKLVFKENNTIYIVKEYAARELMQNNK